MSSEAGEQLRIGLALPSDWMVIGGEAVSEFVGGATTATETTAESGDAERFLLLAEESIRRRVANLVNSNVRIALVASGIEEGPTGSYGVSAVIAVARMAPELAEEQGADDRAFWQTTSSLPNGDHEIPLTEFHYGWRIPDDPTLMVVLTFAAPAAADAVSLRSRFNQLAGAVVLPDIGTQHAS